MREEVRQVRSQLEAERADRKLIEEECWDKEEVLDQTRAELADLKQKSVTARDLPDSYDLLNQVKAKLPKLKVTHGDIQKILEILEES